MFNNIKNNYLKITFSRNNVFAENLKSIMVRLTDKHDTQFHVWLNKNNVFYSNYSDKLTASIIDATDYTYNVYRPGNTDWKRPDGVYGGKELYDLIDDWYKINSYEIDNKNAQ